MKTASQAATPRHLALRLRRSLNARRRTRSGENISGTNAPDLNPDEFVWQHAKTNGVSKKPLKQNESLKKRVEEDLAAIKSNPKLIKSFFHAPSVAYAKD